MVTSRLTGLPVGIPSRAMPDGADARIGLVAAIQQLVRHIELMGDGAPVAHGGAGIRRWEGGGYIYVEAALKPGGDEEIDISVHDGRVFVRIASTGGLDGPPRGGPLPARAGGQ